MSYRTFESRDGSHWQPANGGRNGNGTYRVARRVLLCATHAVILPFAALTMVAVFVTLPFLYFADRMRGR